MTAKKPTTPSSSQRPSWRDILAHDPNGWPPVRWIRQLERRAARVQRHHSVLAGIYRAWVKEINAETAAKPRS